MPAISSQDGWTMELERREWKNTVGQSGMTPTAFAFLIPVFVVVVFCPFLCVFCIRRRQRTTPIPRVRPQKKPSLRREEARQRLALVTDVVGATEERKKDADAVVERKEDVADTASVSERECAICLCSLHAPSPPEPALITSQSTVDDAVLPTPQPTSTTATPPTTTDPVATDASIIPPDPSILKLHICAHEFHASCLVSWFVLRKTTCPICRAAYISKEDFAAYEDEEAEAVGATSGVEQMGVVDPPVIVGRHVIGVPGGFTGEGRRIRAPGTEARVSNWRYFWRGEGVWGGRGAAQSQAQSQAHSGETQTQTPTPGVVEEGGVPRQQPQSTWRRMIVQGM
ncbi:hypothetical protein FB567DRAFT_597055 [Paraphoma chrysanthemicola]|uniref:RING-type domain-containing protein n=1 Tax=Paraphoma chrysanthemicola TaxID=798071 RepID=A0A8K0QY95_9PLEO|nr:hypothetical protein FB567DRAFT_597055 [Paraphoma chrysanthemicola]